jgi:hypothetical protein
LRDAPPRPARAAPGQVASSTCFFRQAHIFFRPSLSWSESRWLGRLRVLPPRLGTCTGRPNREIA